MRHPRSMFVALFEPPRVDCAPEITPVGCIEEFPLLVRRELACGRRRERAAQRVVGGFDGGTPIDGADFQVVMPRRRLPSAMAVRFYRILGLLHRLPLWGLVISRISLFLASPQDIQLLAKFPASRHFAQAIAAPHRSLKLSSCSCISGLRNTRSPDACRS